MLKLNVWKLTENTGLLHCCHILSEENASQYSASLLYHHASVKVFVPHVRISLKANYFLHAPLAVSFTSGDARIHQCVWNPNPLFKHFGTTIGPNSTAFVPYRSKLTFYHWRGLLRDLKWFVTSVVPCVFSFISQITNFATKLNVQSCWRNFLNVWNLETNFSSWNGNATQIFKATPYNLKVLIGV